MGYALRAGLSFCLVDGHAIFLDVPADRYFQLTRDAEAAFVSLQGSPGGDLSDLARFQLSRVLEEAPFPDQLLPPAVPHPIERSEAMNWDRTAPVSILRALLAQLAMERMLRQQGLARTISRLRRQKDRISPIAKGGGVFERWVQGFEQTKLLRSPVGRCLPRSMALASCLFRAGFEVQLVMGIRLRPFAAHCWVQNGGTVLNDSAEEVATFKPVFLL